MHAQVRSLYLALAAFALLTGPCAARCQTPDATTPTTPTPDAKIVEPEKPKTPAQLKEQAWTMLTTAVTDDKHEETRTQALAALGLMGANPRSLNMIKDAMKDKDVDIRVAAALAAGETKSSAGVAASRACV